MVDSLFDDEYVAIFTGLKIQFRKKSPSTRLPRQGHHAIQLNSTTNFDVNGLTNFPQCVV
jgi:hypothetical protein